MSPPTLFPEEQIAKRNTVVEGTRLRTSINLKGNSKLAATIREAKDKLVWPHNYLICKDARDLGRVAKEISRHRTFAFDTETSGVNPWSCELYCVSIWVNGFGYLINFKHTLLPVISLETFKANLGSYFTDDSIVKQGFNINFDGHVLENAGIPVGYLHFDSYLAGRILFDSLPKGVSRALKPYCERVLGTDGGTYSQTFGNLAWIAYEPSLAAFYACKDAELHGRLADWSEEQLKKNEDFHKLFHKLEVPQMNYYFDTERKGLPVDEHYFKETILPPLLAQIEGLKEQMRTHGMPEGVSPDSPAQLADYLFVDLGLPRINKNSTDKAVLQELIPKHPVVAPILEYRSVTKLKSGFIDSISALVVDGKIHPSWNTIGSETGRSSCERPNMLNMPAKVGPLIRQGFIAPPGYNIVSKDYSGQELRWVAHYAEDPALTQAILYGDLYSEVAATYYGGDASLYTKHGDNKDKRAVGKVAVLALFYGASEHKMAQVFGCSKERALKFLNDFYARYPRLKVFQDRCKAFARKYGYINTMLGRRRTLDFFGTTNMFQRFELERLAVNSPVQGTAADQIKLAHVLTNRFFHENRLQSWAPFPIHDELMIFAYKREWTDELSREVDDIMINAIPCKVPMEISTENYGSRWGMIVDD